MPHVSGGGSSGGGFHGGFSGRGFRNISSGNKLYSNQWFAGSRIYLKHYGDGRSDEYVYANLMPRKTGLAPVIVLSLLGALFLPMMGRSVYEVCPKKIVPAETDMPKVYDGINVIENDDALEQTLTEYQDLTGICPVVYTVYKESYDDLLTNYTMTLYRNSFKDEHHFVIVYSVSEADTVLVQEGKLDRPYFNWAAIQGDDTDPYITKEMFNTFGGMIQEGFEKGDDPGVVLNSAFRFAIEDAKNGGAKRFTGVLVAFLPIVAVGAIFILILTILFRRYLKDNQAVYVEVSKDSIPADIEGGYSGNHSVKSSNNPAANIITVKKTPKIARAIGILISLPFVLAGISASVIGILMLANPANDKGIAIQITICGIFTLIMSLLLLISFVSSLIRAGKTEDKIIEDNKRKAKEKVSSDDEDYKRMKSKGFE